MSVVPALRDSGTTSKNKPSRRLAALGSFLHMISFALWLGGLIGIGALVAPNAAHVIHSYPAFASDPNSQKAILTGIIGGSLRVFNIICYATGMLMIVAGALEMSGADSPYRTLTLARIVVTALLLSTTIYLGFGLFPALDTAQAAGQMARFDAIHKQYEWVSQAQLMPLLLIAAITAWRDRS